MRAIALFFAASMIVGCTTNGETKQPPSGPDLTGRTAEDFKANLGRVVSISGRLEDGKFGYTLSADKVGFYIHRTHDGDSHSDKWEELNGHEVRVTGKLQFVKYSPVDPAEMPMTAPIDHYYMDQNATRIAATLSASRLLISAGMLATLAILFIVVALRGRHSAMPPPAG